MKKLLITCLLMFPVLSFSQNWIRASYSDEATFYVEVDSIKKIGNSRRVWVMQDMVKKGTNGVLSRRNLEEFDCVEEKYKLIQVTTFSGNMGTGGILMSFPASGEWNYISPGTLDHGVLRFACSK
jgi:hypothetical protein